MRAEIADAELIRRTREQSLLASCAELLAWDEDTYMPPAGAEHRAAQLALRGVSERTVQRRWPAALRPWVAGRTRYQLDAAGGLREPACSREQF